MMEVSRIRVKKRNLILHLWILFFTISVSVTVIPCGGVNIYGLFGELQSTMVTRGDRVDTEEIKSVHKESATTRGANVYNIWFELAIAIICFTYSLYALRLPKGRTIVTLKTRMDC